MLVRLVQFLYESDILSEEIIIDWHENLATDDGTKQKEIKQQVQKLFVKMQAFYDGVL